MQRREQPVARAVAGEHAAGAVAAVRGRGEPQDDDRRRRVAEARHRPAPVGLAGERARLTRATSSRQATSRGQRRQETISALQRRAALVSAGPARRLTTGVVEQAEDQPVDHRRQVEHVLGDAEAHLARDELGDRADDGERVMRRGEAADQPAARGGGVLGVEHVRERLEDLVAALGGARAGADDLHQQRLRELGVLGQRAEEGARPGAHPLARVADGRAARRARPSPPGRAPRARSNSASMHSSLLAKCS